MFLKLYSTLISDFHKFTLLFLFKLLLIFDLIDLYINSLKCFGSLYSSGFLIIFAIFLKITQSSRALPGGYDALYAVCNFPSKLTNKPFFSVYAAPGKMMSAIYAPLSP